MDAAELEWIAWTTPITTALGAARGSLRLHGRTVACRQHITGRHDLHRHSFRRGRCPGAAGAVQPRQHRRPHCCSSGLDRCRGAGPCRHERRRARRVARVARQRTGRCTLRHGRRPHRRRCSRRPSTGRSARGDDHRSASTRRTRDPVPGARLERDRPQGPDPQPSPRRRRDVAGLHGDHGLWRSTGARSSWSGSDPSARASPLAPAISAPSSPSSISIRCDSSRHSTTGAVSPCLDDALRQRT